MRLTTEKERGEIRQIVDRRTVDLVESDLGVLGYWEWRDALERGIAAHHAGLLPVFKETVEELFVAGLVKAVFATETLALGINMPARTVVLEKLSKYNGEGHADLTAGEYTQLTGRAGRRGIDIEGHAVVVWSPGMDPRAVGGLASRRTYPLRSSFRPSYNMAVNLVDRLGRTAARDLLEQSFAQYQANAAVVGPGPAGQPELRGHRVARQGDAVPSRRHRVVPGAADRSGRRGEGDRQGRRVPAPRRDRPRPGGTAPRRRHRGADRPAGRAGRRPRSGRRRRRVRQAAGGHRGQLGGPAHRRRLPRAGAGARPAAAGQVHRSPHAQGAPRRRIGAGLVRDPADRPGRPPRTGRGDRPDGAPQGDPGAPGARLRGPGRARAVGAPLAPA